MTGDYQQDQGILLRVTKTRQIIQRDEELLKNRLQMLLKEEQKLNKKITLTKDHAEKILRNKLENDNIQRQRMEIKIK